MYRILLLEGGFTKVSVSLALSVSNKLPPMCALRSVQHRNYARGLKLNAQCSPSSVHKSPFNGPESGTKSDSLHSESSLP